MAILSETFRKPDLSSTNEINRDLTWDRLRAQRFDLMRAAKDASGIHVLEQQIITFPHGHFPPTAYDAALLGARAWAGLADEGTYREHSVREISPTTVDQVQTALAIIDPNARSTTMISNMGFVDSTDPKWLIFGGIGNVDRDRETHKVEELEIVSFAFPKPRPISS